MYYVQGESASFIRYDVQWPVNDCMKWDTHQLALYKVAIRTQCIATMCHLQGKSTSLTQDMMCNG